MNVSQVIQRAQLAHRSGAGFHLSNAEMTAVLNAAELAAELHGWFCSERERARNEAEDAPMNSYAAGYETGYAAALDDAMRRLNVEREMENEL